MQNELDLEVPGSEAKVTEADMIKALERRYGAVAGNGARYATAYGVRSHAGFDARRTADFVAMDLWPSGGLRLHGHEVKVSRPDWLRELKDPSKAAEFVPYMNCWWLVVSDKRIVRAGELPDDWCYLMAGWRFAGLTQGGLHVYQQLPGRVGKTRGVRCRMPSPEPVPGSQASLFGLEVS